MPLIRCCKRLRGFGRNASAESGRRRRFWRVQGRRVWLPGRYKLVERGGRGWGGGEVGGSAGPFSKSARRGAPTVISAHPPGVNECKGIFRQLPDAEGGRSAESCSALPFSRGLRRPGQAASFSFPCDFGAAVWPVFREG